jgi:hypothetical protein
MFNEQAKSTDLVGAYDSGGATFLRDLKAVAFLLQLVMTKTAM